jgi:hypothetical protein
VGKCGVGNAECGTTGLSGAGPSALECKQGAPSRVHSWPLVGQHHFVSRVLILTVTFVETLVPLMVVVVPKEKLGLLPETATGLPSGGGVVELLDGSLLQPTIKMVADMIPMMTAFFIKRNAAQRRTSLAALQ